MTRPGSGQQAAAELRVPSFDDLVGAGEDQGRDRQAEHLGSLQVDDQLECRRLLYRQIGGLRAVKDLPGVNAELAKALRDPHTIADQAAGRRKLAPRIARWKRMARCQRQELLASAEEERIAADK
jgi:hypothetical protein